MAMLSQDDLNLGELGDEELDRAWDLWFELAQATNEWDPPYEHGVFVGIGALPAMAAGAPADVDVGGKALKKRAGVPSGRPTHKREG